MIRHFFILLLVLSLTVLTNGCRYAYISDNPLLTTKNIMSVRPGMTIDQVKLILGQPVKEYYMGVYKYYCECNPQRMCIDSKHTFEYTSRRMIRPYPMVWIHFNSRKKVKEIYVKKYTLLLDELCIYLIGNNPCDTTDPIIPIDITDVYTTNNKLSDFFN